MDSEPILPDDHTQLPPIVPLHVEGAQVIDGSQSAHGAGRDGPRVAAHLGEPDAAAYRVLLPEEIQPFSRYFSHFTFLPS